MTTKPKPRIVTRKDGIIFHYLGRKLHRLDGPAIDFSQMTKIPLYGGDIWTQAAQEGCLYQWFVNGELHRDNNLPAIEYHCGSKRYYCHGKKHRTDGPAIEYILPKVDDCYPSKQTNHWYVNGIHHREDGPASEYYHGGKQWFFNGQEFNCKTQEELKRLQKLLAFL